jgi:hypothetical protein
MKRKTRLNSSGAPDRMKALQAAFRRTGVGKSRNRFSFSGLGNVVGLVALAGMVSLSLWIIVRDDGPQRDADSRSVYYRRCDDARADGAAPMRLGEPGYRPGLDADRDGVACEPLVVY